MKECFLSIDLGATNGRTIIGYFTDDKLQLEEISRFSNTIIQTGGCFYWNIYALYESIIHGLQIAARRKDIHIQSIGVDSWGVDFVCIGKDGQFLRMPRSYRDPHTEGAPETFFLKIPKDKVYALTGIQVMNINSLFQLDSMRRHQDSALEHAAHILFMPNAISYMLTGEMTTEYTIASTSQLMNAQSRRFEPELLQAVGLSEDTFGRFVQPGEHIGILTPEIQQLTGLGAVPVVAVAGHDTASAVAAVPAIHPNFAYLSSGTWSLMGIEVQNPVINAKANALNFTNEGGVNGTIRLLKNICGMWLLECCRVKWGEISYQELVTEAKEAPAFQSMIYPDDEAFANPTDMVEAIQTYCRNTQQHVPESKGEIARCIFESLALRYRQTLEDLKQLTESPIDVLHIIGGGSRNELLNQFTSNALGIPVIAGPAEATAIGNVMVQAMAAGKATSISSMRELIYHSIELKTYHPCSKEDWDIAYNHFKTIIA